jgi:hypothetical protein
MFWKRGLSYWEGYQRKSIGDTLIEVAVQFMIVSFCTFVGVLCLGGATLLVMAIYHLITGTPF